MRMTTLTTLMSITAVLSSALAAAQQTCAREVCQIEFECYEVPVACGQNEDGTAIVCIEEECELVEVCVQPPCSTQPSPDDVAPRARGSI